MTAWLVIAAVGLGTYAFRATMFVVLGDRRLPSWTDRPLAYVGPAALGALLGGMMLSIDGPRSTARAVELAAVAAAFVMVRRTGDVVRGVVAGFAVLWTLTWLVL